MTNAYMGTGNKQDSKKKKAIKKLKKFFGDVTTLPRTPMPPKGKKGGHFSGKFGDPNARKAYMDFAYGELDSMEHRPKKKEAINSNKKSR
jgi:hypothetical protein